ncbi:MAG TPA: glycosyltransferase [Rhizomicrobium sp.]
MSPNSASRTARTARPPLVIFSPYPPSANGIADYVGELMPHHRAEFDVTLVIADDAAMPEEGNDVPRILLASEFRKHRGFFENAPKLYHVGNNPDHCYMLDLLARDPGIVVLHDYNLNYMHEVATQGWKQRDGYWSALELEYGVLGSEAVRQRFERRDRGQFATYELPLNGDVLEAATGVIVHSRYVQYKVAARVPRKPVWYVPHHLSSAVYHYGQITKAEARRQLGLAENEIIITAPGFITYAKRVPMLLAALSTLRARLPSFRLVLAGERCPDQYDVDSDIANAGLKNYATCTGYLDEEQFFLHLAACDVVANLRHPTGGEMSGTLIRALGMGLPAIVFDIGPMGELPHSVVRKVPWDGDTHAALTAALYELILDKTRREELGARAAAYTRETHAIDKIAGRYSEIIRSGGEYVRPAEIEPVRENFPHPKVLADRIRNMSVGPQPTGSLRPDGRLWWQCAKAPLGQSGRRALILAAHSRQTAEFFAGAFGWRSEDITAMTVEDFVGPTLRNAQGDPIPQGAFTFALVVTGVEMAEISAATLLRRLNAALRRGGNLTFELSCGLDHEYDESPLADSRMVDRLTEAGFAEAARVPRRDGIFAEAVPVSPNESEARRYTCFTARKASSVSYWRFMIEFDGTPQHFGGRIA